MNNTEKIGIGVGITSLFALTGYGIYKAISGISLPNPNAGCHGSTTCINELKGCQQQMSALESEYVTLFQKYIQSDNAENVAMSTTQINNLNDILNQEKDVIDKCMTPIIKKYSMNFQDVVSAILEIAVAGVVSETVYRLLKNKYWKGKKGKKPPQTPYDNGNAVASAILNDMVDKNEINSAWVNSGNGLNTITTFANSQTYNVNNIYAKFISGLIDAGIIGITALGVYAIIAAALTIIGTNVLALAPIIAIAA
uniref:hypothetical protein n=1 Tax=Mycobacterium sp. TaxID=1785 RepID=UPI0031E200EA